MKCTGAGEQAERYVVLWQTWGVHAIGLFQWFTNSRRSTGYFFREVPVKDRQPTGVISGPICKYP